MFPLEAFRLVLRPNDPFSPVNPVRGLMCWCSLLCVGLFELILLIPPNLEDLIVGLGITSLLACMAAPKSTLSVILLSIFWPACNVSKKTSYVLHVFAF